MDYIQKIANMRVVWAAVAGSALIFSSMFVGAQLTMANSDPTVDERVVADWVFEGHQDEVREVVLSEDEEWVYSVSRDDTVRRVSTADGVEDTSWRYEGFAGSISSVAIDSDDNVYAGGSMGSANYAVHSIDSNGDQRWSTSMDSWLDSLYLDEANDNVYAAVGQSEGILRLDINDGSIDGNWDIDIATASELARDNDGNTYVARLGGSAESSVHRFDSDGVEDWEYVHSPGQLYALALSDDHVYFGGSSNEVHRLDRSDGQRDTDYSFDTEDSVRSLELDSNGNLFVGTVGGELTMLDSNGDMQLRYDEFTGWVNGLAFDSSDVVYAASGDNNQAEGADVSKIDFTNLVTFYSVENTPSGVAVIDTDTDVDIRVGEGDTDNQGTTIRLQTEDGVPIASTYMALTNNRDFDAVSADVDTEGNASFVHGLNSLDIGAEGSGTFTLFVPRDESDDQVHICPDASSLSELEEGCTDEKVLDESDADVEIVDWQGSSYWTVEGLEGTGGFSSSSTEEDTTTPGEDEDATGLPDTGVGVSQASSGASTLWMASLLALSLTLLMSGTYLYRRYSQ